MRQCWRRFSLFFLVSLVFCCFFHAWSLGQVAQSAQVERQFIASSPTNEKEGSREWGLETRDKEDKKELSIHAPLSFQAQIPNPQTSIPSQESYFQVVQQAVERYQSGKFTEAIALWQQILPLVTEASEVSLLDAKAAIIYSVILNDHTEMIVRSPDGQLTSYAVPLKQEQIQQEIDQLRKLLEKRSTNEYLLPARKIYNALIRPLEADLAAAKVKTLIFIQDDGLRQVPMAALHDGKQFLIQKYAIATAPSLTLTTRTSTPEHYSGALIMGLTVERPPFKALTNVRTEVASVQQILGGTKLLDRDFTLANLQEQLQNKSYPVVHIATHGKFGVDSASSFLLSFDSRMTLEQLALIEVRA